MGSGKFNDHQIRKLENMIGSIIELDRILDKKSIAKGELNGLRNICKSRELSSLEKKILAIDAEVRLGFDYPIEIVKSRNINYIDGKKVVTIDIDIEGVPLSKPTQPLDDYINMIQNMQKDADQKILNRVAAKCGLSLFFVKTCLDIIEMKFILEEKYELLDRAIKSNNTKFVFGG